MGCGPSVPLDCEDSCLSLGSEEEQQVINVLFLDGEEGESFLPEEGLEHVVKPDLEDPGGAGFSHGDSRGSVEFPVNLKSKVGGRVWVAWYVVESGRYVVVKCPLIAGRDAFHEAGHPW
jgi:hypothetical protein